MATKKDLTEAYAFSRRRLVTAFVSGAPGGREVEPARPGRTIVGGLALSVLLVAGAAVAGVFSPRVDENWASQPGLFISKETGAAYVITAVEDGEDPVLRPIINITSAKLILGADIEPEIIPEEYINAERRGEDIGILGAPATVPGTDQLVDDGWTACTAEDQGLRFVVAEDPEVSPAPGDGALLVEVKDEKSDDAVYLIAQGPAQAGQLPRAYSYRVPDSKNRDNLLSNVGLPLGSGSAVEVPEEWLELFPPGGELTRDAFGVEGAGESVPYAADSPELAGAKVGDVLDSGTEQLVLTREGMAPLDPFEAAVYLATGDPDVRDTDELPALGRDSEAFAGLLWPDSTVTPLQGEHCAQLQASADASPGVRLVTAPGPTATPYEVDEGKRSIAVDEGLGAYVLSGSWDQATAGEPHLVDAKGDRYPLVGTDTVAGLGYDEYPAPRVPDPWIQLFDVGVPLSTSAALCPPSVVVGRPCD